MCVCVCVCVCDSCIKMDSDEGHFNVSLTARDKVTRECPQTTTFEHRGEPKRNRTEVLLLISLTPYAKPNRLTDTQTRKPTVQSSVSAQTNVGLRLSSD